MRRLAGLAAAGAIVLSACTPVTRPTDELVGPALDLGRGRLELAASLQSFAECGEVLDYFQDSATEMGAAFAFGGMGGVASTTLDGFAVEERAMAAGDAAEGAPASSAPTTAAPQAGVDYSTTNVQEAGVDEPDIVKTDGSLIVAVARNTLHVVDATGDVPELRGSLPLGDGRSYGGEIFLAGDRVLVVANGWRDDAGATRPRDRRESGDIAGPVPIGGSVAVLTSVDISDPTSPKVESRKELDGEYVTARLVDGIARVVLRSTPQFHIQPLPGAETQAQVRDQVRTAVAATEIDDWLPSVRTDDGRSEPLVACDAVSRPPEPSGVGTVTVLTVDTGKELDIAHTASVVADVGTVYASTAGLYIATNGWTDPRILERQAVEDDAELPFFTTELHKFDISDPTVTSYVASGRVRGHLLNQWSLSEHAGHLRVATTEFPESFGRPAPEARQSESFVSVFRQDGDVLDQVGQVGELGLDERIFAVRYFGDTGYVVTFRQTDPLYVLDLSNPAAPTVTGELKILGYSAYLHPVGDGILLGVGQDATEEGRTLGTQLSLFDVRDAKNPDRIHQTSLGGANSAVEFDHRAFLWWATEQLAVLPLQIHGGRGLAGPTTPEERTFVEPDEPGEPDEPAPDAIAPSSPPPQDFFAGAVGFTVDASPDGGFAERGRLSHAGRNSAEPFPAAVTRSLVIGDSLYTLSEVGLLASDLATFGDRGWVSF